MQLKPGDVTTINGQRARYLGDGKFEPVPPAAPAPEGELMAKRFDNGESRPLGGPRYVP